MSNFHNKHQKLLSAILVAVFVIGGVAGMVGSVRAADVSPTSFEPVGQININNSQTVYQLFADMKGNYYASIIPYGPPSGATEYYNFDAGYANYLQDARGLNNNNPITLNQSDIDNKIKGLSPITDNNLFGNKPLTPAAAEQRRKDLAETAIRESSNTPNALEQILGSMIAWFLYYIAFGLGGIMMLITKVMLVIAVFNNFLGQPVVKVGWTITRDLCNNFFIILMMILAGGQVLHIPNYQWKSMLPKILIWAVLINFSMTFTGILIDVSQVIMLTFASPLATVQGYNIIISAFGLPDAFSLTAVLEKWKDGKGRISGGGNITIYDIVAALMFAVIVTIVSIVVIGCIVAILAYRLIMLMFLVILSPLYFFSKATSIAGLGSIGNEWMGKLTNMLTVGPTMLFFLYLSFMIMASVNNLNYDSAKNSTGQTKGSMLQGMNVTEADKSIGKTPGGVAVTSPLNTTSDKDAGQYIALSNMASVQGVLNFVIVIGLLMVSLMMGKKFGDAAGSVAGKGMGMLSSAAKKYSGFNLASKGVGKLAQAPGAIAKGVGAKIGTGAIGATTLATRGAGWVAGKVGWKTTAEGLGKLGEVGTQWRKDILGNRRKARIAKLAKLAGSIGMGSDEMKMKWGEFTDTDFAKKSKQVALTAGALTAGGVAAVATGGLATVPGLAGAAGLGLIPGVATVAAGYVGGGGRLVELLLGKKALDREKARTEEEKKINEAKGKTAEIVALSERARDQDVESKTKTYLSTSGAKNAKKVHDDAQKYMDKIEGTKLDDQNKLFGSGIDQSLLNEITAQGWSAGSREITQDELDKAKIAVKASQSWKDSEKDVVDYNTNHSSKLQKIKDDEEIEHKRRVESQLSGPEKARFTAEYDAKAKLTLDTAKIKQDLETTLATVRANTGLNTMGKLQAEQTAKFEADKKISDANNLYSTAIARVQPQASKPGRIDTMLEDYKPYAHENWVSQGVAKEARQMVQAVKDLVSAMEDAGSELLNGFDQISKGSFYSNNGQTETQFRSLKAMIESTKAQQNLTDALTAMPQELKGQQAQLVKELKQGIAAYKKGGGDITKLAAIISLLDQKIGKNADGKIIDDQTVSQYEAKIKPKK